MQPSVRMDKSRFGAKSLTDRGKPHTYATSPKILGWFEIPEFEVYGEKRKVNALGCALHDVGPRSLRLYDTGPRLQKLTRTTSEYNCSSVECPCNESLQGQNCSCHYLQAFGERLGIGVLECNIVGRTHKRELRFQPVILD